MILDFILAGLGGAAVLFLLVFLKAVMNELRLGQPRPNQQRRNKSLTLVMLERYRDRDRAA